MKRFPAIFLSFILLVASHVSVMAQEPYVIKSPDGTMLTFYFDDQKKSRQGKAYVINKEGQDNAEGVGKDMSFLVLGIRHYVTTVVFDESFKGARPESCRGWFRGFSGLTKIEGMENLKTSSVTDMSYMFNGCSGLTSLDLSGFDTSNVTSMSGLFSHCSSLKNLDLSGFNTSNVTDMSGLFEGCRFATIDFRGFDTSNVKYMGSMFAFCDIKNLDLSKLNTSKVVDMSRMFSGCCLTSIDMSYFDTSNVTDMSEMFAFCMNLKTVYVGDGWNTSKVIRSEWMFDKVAHLVGGNGTRAYYSNANKTRAKIDGGKSNPGYFTAKK